MFMSLNLRNCDSRSCPSTTPRRRLSFLPVGLIARIPFIWLPIIPFQRSIIGWNSLDRATSMEEWDPAISKETRRLNYVPLFSLRTKNIRNDCFFEFKESKDSHNHILNMMIRWLWGLEHQSSGQYDCRITNSVWQGKTLFGKRIADAVIDIWVVCAIIEGDQQQVTERRLYNLQWRTLKPCSMTQVILLKCFLSLKFKFNFFVQYFSLTYITQIMT